jgi:hypothetical protein
MSDPHVVTALRRKRAEVSGYIADLERKIARQQVNLAHIDATIRLFSPDTDPSAIPPKRTYRRTRYFAKGELSRRCLDALRTANGAPITAMTITKAVMADKALPANDATLASALTEMVLTILRRLYKRGTAVKSGTSRNAQWVLAPSLI